MNTFYNNIGYAKILIITNKIASSVSDQDPVINRSRVDRSGGVINYDSSSLIPEK